MNNQHLIDQTMFDIACDSELLARELQPVLDSFVKKNLMTVVDDEFGQASVNGIEVRIDKLEIDLGNIQYSDYQNEMPKRLREALKSRLSEMKQSLVSGKASNQGYVVKRGDEFDQLKFFLLHGYLPWYARISTQAELENLLQRGLAKAGGEFRHFLQHISSKKTVLSRLVNQFSSDLLAQVFENISPALAKSANGYMASLAQRPALSAASATHLSRQVWLQMMTTVLKADSTQLSAQQLFEHSLKEVLNHNDEVFEGLFEAKQGNSGVALNDDEFGLILDNVFTELSNKLETVELQDDQARAGQLERAALESLRERLISAIHSGDSSILESDWVSLIKEHKTLLEQTLRRYGQQTLIRKKIAYGFAEAILQDILLVLEPLEYGFVISFIERPSLFAADEDKHNQYESVAKKQLWEFSLGYLLVERGSRFNKKAYLYSLLNQMAVARCQSYAELLKHLSDHVMALPKSSLVVKQISQLLSELAQEWTKSIVGAAPVEQLVSDNYHHYELLKSIIEDKVFNASIDEVTFSNSINALINHAPWLLRKLFIRLRENPKQLNESLSEQVIQQLITTYFKLSNGQGSGQNGELKQSLHRFAGQVFDKKYFYRKVFLGLIRDQLIDFELLLSQHSQAFDNNQHAQAVSRSKAEQELKSAENYAQLIATVLDSNSQPHGAVAQKFIYAIEQLLSESTSKAKCLFGNLLADEVRLSRVTYYLPEHLLIQLVDFMASRVSVRALHKSGFSQRSEFSRAIAVYAEKSEDRQNYYQKILQSLISEDVVNFELDTKQEHTRNQEQAVRDIYHDEISRGTVDDVRRMRGSSSYQEACVKAFLQTEQLPTEAEKQRFIYTIEQILSQSPGSIRDVMDRLRERKTGILRLIDHLPVRLLSKMLTSNLGSAAARMLHVAELLMNACYECKAFSSSVNAEHFNWMLAFDYVIDVGSIYNERMFLQRYVNALLKLSSMSEKEIRVALVRQLRAHGEILSSNIIDKIISALRDEDFSEEVVGLYSEDISVSEADLIDEVSVFQEEVYVENAGLVLATPYLPRLFDLMGLTENRAFKTRDAAVRAVHLLQFLVNESCSSPEYQLVLNKLLCGVKTDTPIAREIDVSSEEKQHVEGLLHGVIQNWKVLGNTSLTGLRESFLQRSGTLKLKDDTWYLRVEEKAFDMLLHQIPWGFSTIKYPWMERVIYVEWR